jgi:hypothetical protein
MVSVDTMPMYGRNQSPATNLNLVSMNLSTSQRPPMITRRLVIQTNSMLKKFVDNQQAQSCRIFLVFLVLGWICFHSQSQRPQSLLPPQMLLQPMLIFRHLQKTPHFEIKPLSVSDLWFIRHLIELMTPPSQQLQLLERVVLSGGLIVKVLVLMASALS